MKKRCGSSRSGTTEFEKFCDGLDALVDDWGDSEKKLVLWKLLDYYRDGLLDDLFVAKDEEDIRELARIRNQMDVCEAIRETIRKEIF